MTTILKFVLHIQQSSASPPLPPHSAVQSPATQRRSPAERRMKTTPCPSLPPPRPPATSRLLRSPRKPLHHPAARLRAPASGAWRKCPSLFPHCKVGRNNNKLLNTSEMICACRQDNSAWQEISRCNETVSFTWKSQNISANMSVGLHSTYFKFFSVYIPLLPLRRLWGDRLSVPVAGDRRSGSAAAEGGTPHVHHEHQARSCAQDLRPH